MLVPAASLGEGCARKVPNETIYICAGDMNLVGTDFLAAVSANLEDVRRSENMKMSLAYNPEKCLKRPTTQRDWIVCSADCHEILTGQPVIASDRMHQAVIGHFRRYLSLEAAEVAAADADRAAKAAAAKALPAAPRRPPPGSDDRDEDHEVRLEKLRIRVHRLWKDHQSRKRRKVETAVLWCRGQTQSHRSSVYHSVRIARLGASASSILSKR